ncbi:gamma-glutamyltranspeptidase-like protein [Amniculicola lignicola CBS 123094]|uniref:Glutathione hydrolase n=1 Tax=Amniculicola lignicola CBS 123094 TaxID=1392246 RepID=A0A6A5WAC0_9PLEO|nr:gamma-glutamyltranspeptidase-like protein [Amniculicola lignicola CBS 123094]
MVHMLAKYLTGLLALQPALASSGGHPHRYEEGKLGAVASESEICSHIGIELLRKGGNAADALVGTTFCIGVVGMYHSGLGGGGFMLVRASNGTYEFIDFRETAPAAAFEDMYNNNNTDASLTGGLASGVPGEVRGLQYLHENYGKLAWATVLKPVIKVAREGWTVNVDLVNYMNSAISTAKQNLTNNFLVDDPQFAQDFAPKGRLVKLNETISRKRYADTLEMIACEGPDAFYEGPIAEATVNALQASNGTMTLEDLKNYTVALRKPSTITYRGYKLTACSAPSGGEVALAVLKTMEGYDRIGDPGNVNLTTHRLDEAMRFAYGERANLGDPLFLKGIDEYQEQMISEMAAKEVRSKISDTKTFNVSYYDPLGLESLETPGTSHVVTADYTGLSITLTTTVNLLFGSQLVIPETGVIMNNEMNDFSIPNTTNAFGYIPSPANFIRPGKRPLSSISPIIVEHLHAHNPLSAFYLSIGAAGGSRIITATIQNLIHILDGGLSVPEALARPRIHDQLVPAYVSFEYDFDNRTVAFLEDLGHNVTWVAPGQSTAQGLRRLRNGTFEAGGEPRQRNSGGFVV